MVLIKAFVIHWGRVTHICVRKLIIICSENVVWSATSHHLNQWWNIINWILGNKLQWNPCRNLFISTQLTLNVFENTFWKMVAILSQPQYVKTRSSRVYTSLPWWRHQMETFSALLAICAGNSPVPGEFPSQRPVTQSFDVFFDLRPNKRLSKQWGGWWFETPSSPLWRHCNSLNAAHSSYASMINVQTMFT